MGGGGSGGAPGELTVVGIAKWKDDAKGAYTLHHDDAGNYTSETTFCVPELDKRGFRASFGVIANLVEKASDEVARLTAAAKNGHEMMSHSYTHVPKVTNGCDGVMIEACGGGAGGDKEIVQSKTIIEKALSTSVTYFIYPYDFRHPDVGKLVEKTYLGDRSGYGPETSDKGGVNPADFGDFENAFEKSGEEVIKLADMNSHVDAVIKAGGYGIRELHGIGDKSYGNVSKEDYVTHLDYMKTKADAGDLWVTTSTGAIKYKHVRMGDCGQPTVSGKTISFPKATADACKKYATEVSILVMAPGASLKATQGGAEVPVIKKGDHYIINADPTKGEVVCSN